MTPIQDSQAVLKANELLQDPDAAVVDLKAALDAIRGDMRELTHGDPAKRGVASATSLEERRKMEEAERLRVTRLEVATAVFRRLHGAIGEAEARDAIAQADDHRASLSAALDRLEEARRVAAEAKAAAMDALESLEKAKKAAGLRGRGLVGADPEQIDKVLDLEAVRPSDIAPEGHVKHTAVNRLRRVAQREVSQSKAS